MKLMPSKNHITITNIYYPILHIVTLWYLSLKNLDFRCHKLNKPEPKRSLINYKSQISNDRNSKFKTKDFQQTTLFFGPLKI